MKECAQVEEIRDIKDTLRTVAEAVSKIAVQDQRMVALERKNDEQDADINGMYDRLRIVEATLGVNGDGIRVKVIDALSPFTVQLDRLERLLNVVTSRAFVIVSASLGLMVLAGALCDMVYHSAFLGFIYDWIVKVWKVIPR